MMHAKRLTQILLSTNTFTLSTTLRRLAINASPLASAAVIATLSMGAATLYAAEFKSSEEHPHVEGSAGMDLVADHLSSGAVAARHNLLDRVDASTPSAPIFQAIANIPAHERDQVVEITAQSLMGRSIAVSNVVQRLACVQQIGQYDRRFLLTHFVHDTEMPGALIPLRLDRLFQNTPAHQHVFIRYLRAIKEKGELTNVNMNCLFFSLHPQKDLEHRNFDGDIYPAVIVTTLRNSLIKAIDSKDPSLFVKENWQTAYRSLALDWRRDSLNTYQTQTLGHLFAMKYLNAPKAIAQAELLVRAQQIRMRTPDLLAESIRGFFDCECLQNLERAFQARVWKGHMDIPYAGMDTMQPQAYNMRRNVTKGRYNLYDPNARMRPLIGQTEGHNTDYATDRMLTYTISVPAVTDTMTAIVISVYGGFSANFKQLTYPAKLPDGRIGSIGLNLPDVTFEMHQSEQLKPRNFAGTHAQLLRATSDFISAVKHTYPNIPVYLQGTSFGGFFTASYGLLQSVSDKPGRMSNVYHYFAANAFSNHFADCPIEKVAGILSCSAATDFVSKLTRHEHWSQHLTVPTFFHFNFDDYRVKFEDAFPAIQNADGYNKYLTLCVNRHAAGEFLEDAAAFRGRELADLEAIMTGTRKDDICTVRGHNSQNSMDINQQMVQFINNHGRNVDSAVHKARQSRLFHIFESVVQDGFTADLQQFLSNRRHPALSVGEADSETINKIAQLSGMLHAPVFSADYTLKDHYTEFSKWLHEKKNSRQCAMFQSALKDHICELMGAESGASDAASTGAGGGYASGARADEKTESALSFEDRARLESQLFRQQVGVNGLNYFSPLFDEIDARATKSNIDSIRSFIESYPFHAQFTGDLSLGYHQTLTNMTTTKPIWKAVAKKVTHEWRMAKIRARAHAIEDASVVAAAVVASEITVAGKTVHRDSPDATVLAEYVHYYERGLVDIDQLKTPAYTIFGHKDAMSTESINRIIAFFSA